MQANKRCVQCGILKSVDEFRKYTYARAAETEGRYRVCRACENINTKYRRALKEGNDEVYASIRKMYVALESLGYRTPLSATAIPTKQDAVDFEIDKILKHHGVDVTMTVKKDPTHSHEKALAEEAILYADGSSTSIHNLRVEKLPVGVEDAPEELRYWLESSMDDWTENGMSPEYLQETIYESLKAKYRPQTGVDPMLYIPTYDDTYKTVLNAILRRFDDYEDAYSEPETDIETPVDCDAEALINLDTESGGASSD